MIVSGVIYPFYKVRTRKTPLAHPRRVQPPQTGATTVRRTGPGHNRLPATAQPGVAFGEADVSATGQAGVRATGPGQPLLPDCPGSVVLFQALGEIAAQAFGVGGVCQREINAGPDEPARVAQIMAAAVVDDDMHRVALFNQQLNGIGEL